MQIRNRFFLIFFTFLFFISINFIPLGDVYPNIKDHKGIIIIDNGESRDKIINNLSFLSSDITLFRLFSLGRLKKITAGKYFIDFNKNFVDNIKEIGVKQRIKITFYEGITRKEVIRKIFEHSTVTLGEFYNAEKKIIKNRKICEKFKIYRNAKNLEGYLFPDTYYFYTNESAFNMITKMLNRYIDVLKELNIYYLSPQKIYKTVIIASLIQKESGINEEPLVASVIQNRLKKHMKLQIDATILYALAHDGIKTRDITLNNKYYDSPYNTYVYRGLPAGPICNPGKKSLKAAVFPLKTDYLYYVSKNNGSHYFSKTYKEHMKKVNKYQKISGE